MDDIDTHISNAAKRILDRENLYPHQKEAVRYLVYDESDTSDHDCDSKFLFVGSMTGSGKSTIAYLATAMMAKVTIFIVPTIPLGVDQQTKLYQKLLANCCVEHGLCTCFRLPSKHINDTECQNALNELSKLPIMPPHQRPGVVLFCNPDVIFEVETEGTWGHYLAGDDFRSLVGLMVFDEAHLVLEHGLTFRDAYKQLNRVVKAIPCTKLAMTASFTKDYATKFQEQIGARFTKKIWSGSLAFSRAESVKIKLSVRQPGTISVLLDTEIKKLLGKKENFLVFTNKIDRAFTLAERINELILDNAVAEGEDAESVEGNEHVCCDQARPLTGDMLSEEKCFTMKYFCRKLPSSTVEEEGAEVDTYLRYLVATAGLASCGLDCNIAGVLMEGFPSSLSELFQQMGRLVRSFSVSEGVTIAKKQYYLCMNLASYVHIRTRPYHTKTDPVTGKEIKISPEGRRFQDDCAMEVLNLMFARKCWHFNLACKFGNPAATTADPQDWCTTGCPHCSGDIESMKRPFVFAKMKIGLTSIFSQQAKIEVDSFASILHQLSETIWGRRNMPRYEIEWVVLGMISEGILCTTVVEETKVSKNKVESVCNLYAQPALDSSGDQVFRNEERWVNLLAG